MNTLLEAEVKALQVQLNETNLFMQQNMRNQQDHQKPKALKSLQNSFELGSAVPIAGSQTKNVDNTWEEAVRTGQLSNTRKTWDWQS